MFPMYYHQQIYHASDDAVFTRRRKTDTTNFLTSAPGVRYFENRICYMDHNNSYIARFDCGYAHKPAGFTIRNRICTQLIFEYVLDGTQTYNDMPMRAGDFIFVEPYSSYTSVIGDDDVTLIWCSIEGDILSHVADAVKSYRSDKIYHFDFTETLLPMFEAVIYNRHFDTIDFNRYVFAFIDQLLALLTAVDNRPPEPSLLVQRALALIGSDYRTIKVASLAGRLLVAPGYLCRKFHQDMGMSPKQYITQTKLAFAVFYLTNTDQSIKQIADAVGYANYANFYAAFRAQYGMSPDAYRSAYGYAKNNVDRKM